MKKHLYLFLAAALTTPLILSSCGGEPADSSDTEETTQTKPKSTSDGASILKVGDKLFNLPSPLETAMLLEEVGGDFNEDILNPVVDAEQYTTRDVQAMNLGVYGADLGYCLIYNQSQKAFTLLATCKKLGTGIGISPALYSGLIERFEGNMENKDSLLIFVSELNRLSDEYLKENESEDISAMILYGGWVESLYFLSQLSATMNNDELRTRVGEQKNTLENLIGLIDQQNIDGSFDVILTDLRDLKTTFAKVNTEYSWVEPETKPDQQLTIIKSKSSVALDEALMEEISEKVIRLRNRIISTPTS